MILLIDNYDSFTFNLYQHMGELGAEVDVIRNDQITLDQIESRLPEIDQIVVSPGPCTPIEAGISVDVIRRFAGRTPILGVCLGHQAIGEAFGAEIVGAPHIMHGKTSRIHHDGAGVFRDLPNPLEATRYHSLVVRRDSLPDELQVVAETEDGIVMGLRHRDFPIYGVQFHPESILTPAGKDLLRNFLGLAPVGSTVTPLELVGY